jgi:hypothetical protein
MKSNQLVCQYLENISRKALENYGKIIKGLVRGRHGIYALYQKNKLYYVGLASNLNSRLKHHLRDRHANTWDRFSVYLTVEDRSLRELESLAVRIASPKGNRQVGKFAQAENFMRKFRRSIKGVQDYEIKEIIGDSKHREETIRKKEITGRKSALAPYVSKFRTKKLRFNFKGKLYRAHIRNDGSIFFRGKIYTSPSLAAKAVVKRSQNGWSVWKYERAPGEWVFIDNLRK